MDYNPLPWYNGMFTLEDMARDPVTRFDRRLEYAWDDELFNNANIMISRLNQLANRLPLNLRNSLQITSAYRPGKYNSRAGGAPNSLHTTCRAIDLANLSNALGIYLLENPSILEGCNLWAEHPEATLRTRHIHLQIVPPASGNRFFYP